MKNKLMWALVLGLAVMAAGCGKSGDDPKVQTRRDDGKIDAKLARAKGGGAGGDAGAVNSMRGNCAACANNASADVVTPGAIAVPI